MAKGEEDDLSQHFYRHSCTSVSSRDIPGKECIMSHPIPSTVRADDLLRHLQDLRSGTYEGAMSRGAKEAVYRQDINLLRSVAEDKAMAGMDAGDFQTFYQDNLGLIYRF